ncbi:MAG: HRDC domain-containing protein [Anaerolineae bacterium]|nr:HRDC domain-containing protein [Anaerolineae bacterium]
MSQSSTYIASTLLKQPVWIDTPRRLGQLVENLSHQPVVAVDTESDSLYSYFEKVCLVQFSLPHADYLVDPLNVDISGLAAFFANSSIQKVFHAAEYDILSLKRDYDFVFANLFDTMLAARILGWPRYGLGTILQAHFNVKLDKRFQRYNWGNRPLNKKALDYARLDTHYLLPLREIQLKELTRQNRLREATEAFARQTQVEPTPKVFDPDDFWRIKGCRDLLPQQQAILRELFIARDKIARKIDRPPFKVMNDATLIRLAEQQPQTGQALKQMKGLSDKLLRYNTHDILQAIEKGQTAPPPHYSHANNNHRPDDETLARYETLRHWRNNLAAERGVEPDVILSNDTLMDIARHNPQTLKALTQLESLGQWQGETYGQTLLRILKKRA